MPRHDIEMSRAIAPIRGGKFTFRTWADDRFGAGRGRRDHGVVLTLDRLVTVTLPAISGADHTIIPHMEVQL